MIKRLIPIVLLVLLGMPLVFENVPYETLKLKTFDALVPEQQPSGYFTILNITEDDIAREGGYPLSRQRLAEIHLELLNNGALGVGWVIAFPQPDRFGGDPQFSQVLSYAPSVLAMFENDNGDFPPTTGTVIMGDDKGGIDAQGVIQNIDILKENANQGIAVARVEVDSLIRRLPLLLRTPDGWVPAYGTEVLKILTGTDTYVIKTNEIGIEEIRVKGLPPVKTDALGRKWVSWVDTPQTDLKEMDVENKFVFVGFTAKGIMPQLAVPNNQLLEPHKIQAALAESILIENSPYIPDYALALEVGIFALSVLFAWLLLYVFGITLGITLFIGLMLTTAYFGFWTIQQGLLIDVTWALISQFITGSVAFYMRFREQWKKRKQVQKLFSSYLHPRQVKKIIKEDIKLDGERVYSSHLFVDIRNYTTLSEQMEATEVTAMLNRILSMLIDQVHNTNGLHDNTIGDCIYASWNSVVPLDKHENAALECALKMHEKMEELNKELKADGYPELGIGCGINTDWVSQGSIGKIGGKGEMSSVRFTSLGDGVNTAARLESACKELGVNTVIGYNTAIKCDYELRLLQPLKVKGKEKPLQVYTWE